MAAGTPFINLVGRGQRLGHFLAPARPISTGTRSPFQARTVAAARQWTFARTVFAGRCRLDGMYPTNALAASLRPAAAWPGFRSEQDARKRFTPRSRTPEPYRRPQNTKPISSSSFPHLSGRASDPISREEVLYLFLVVWRQPSPVVRRILPVVRRILPVDIYFERFWNYSKAMAPPQKQGVVSAQFKGRRRR